MSLLVNKALACFLAFNSLGLSLDLQTNLKSILFASERSHWKKDSDLLKR